MNEITGFRLCKLSNEELIQKVDAATDKLYEPPFKVPERRIPARPDEDYDLIVGELIIRFDELRQTVATLLAGWNHPDNKGEMWIPDFCGEAIESLQELHDQYEAVENEKSV